MATDEHPTYRGFAGGPNARTVSWLVAAVVALILPAGCAWRMGGDEHYVGPVLFRHREAPPGGARVTEVVRVGLAFEGGHQWGMAVGLGRRISASAVDVCDESSSVPPLRIITWPPDRGARWTFSPIYLRIENTPPPDFLGRSTYGFELAMGPELTALSIGATSRTRLVPPADSISRFVYDASDSLATRFVTCRDVPNRPMPLTPSEW